VKPTSIRLWLIASTLAGIGLAPFLAQGNPQQRQLKREHAAAISRLSETQRERMLRNFATWQALSPEKQQSLEQLHQDLLNDQRLRGGELYQLMLDYHAWLRTLEPHQRDLLANTTDIPHRLSLMREIARRQREQTAGRNMPPIGPGGSDRQVDIPGAMDEKNLAAVIQALQRHAADRLTAEQLDELQKLQGLKHAVRLLELLKEFGTGVNPQPLLENPPREFQQVASEIDQIVTDPQLQEFITHGPQLPGGGGPGNENQNRRQAHPEARRLALALMMSLQVELFKQRRAVESSVDSQKLTEFLNTLAPDEQNALLSLEASDFQTDLRLQYLDAHGMADLPSMRKLGDLFFGARWRMRFNDRRFEGGRSRRTDDRNFGDPGGPPPRRGFGPPPDGSPSGPSSGPSSEPDAPEPASSPETPSPNPLPVPASTPSPAL
jgi:hypothetical protein